MPKATFRRRLLTFLLLCAAFFSIFFFVIKKIDYKDLLFSFIDATFLPKDNIADVDVPSIFRLLEGDSSIVGFSGDVKTALLDLRRNRLFSRWNQVLLGGGKLGVSGIVEREVGFRLKEKDILKLFGDNLAFKIAENSAVLALETGNEFQLLKGSLHILSMIKTRKRQRSESYKDIAVSRLSGVGFPLYTATLGKYSVFSNKKNRVFSSIDYALLDKSKNSNAILKKISEISEKHKYFALAGNVFIKNSFLPILPPLKMWYGWLSRETNSLDINFEGVPKQSDKYLKKYAAYKTAFHDVLNYLPANTVVAASTNSVIPSEIYRAMKKNPYFDEIFSQYLAGHSSPEKKLFPFVGPRAFYFSDGVNYDVPAPFLRQGVGIELHFKKDIRTPLNSVMRYYFGLGDLEPVRGEKRGKEYFYFETDNGLSPCYAFFGDVLVVCLDKESILRMIEREKGFGRSLANKNDFKSYFKLLPKKFHYMYYIDLAGLWDELKDNLELAQNINNIIMVAGMEDDRFLFPKLLYLMRGTSGTLSIENGKVTGRFILR